MDRDISALVSIVIPAYNAERHVAECVDSLLQQSYTNIQIILVNDGSKDRTGTICDALAEKDVRVSVVHQENRGVSAARNHGIQLAAGSLLCFVDSDDTIPPNSISILTQQLIGENVDAVFGNYNYVYGSKSIPRNGRLPESTYTNADIRGCLIDDGTLCGITFGSVCGAIYKTEQIRAQHICFRENLKINEDGIFNVEYCLQAASIRYMSQPVYNYRQWKDGKLPDIDAMKTNLYSASSTLAEICKDLPDNQAVMERQLHARKLFCIFQISVTASTLPRKDAVSVYRSIWSNPDIRTYRMTLNDANMSRFKRILWRLIEKNAYFLFYTAIHDIYPELRKFIKR